MSSTPAPSRLRDGLGVCVVVFLVARIALSIAGAIGVGDAATGGTGIGAPGPGLEVPATSGWHNAFDGLDRWDGTWFVYIADEGYDDEGPSAAFFPLYPMLIRLVAAITGDAWLAATLVANVSFFFALLLLHALTASLFDATTARRAVVLLAVFPSSFIFFAPYSESLYLLASLVAFHSATHARWGLTAVGGMAATVTRSIGITIVPALAMIAWQRRGRERHRGLAAAAATAIGLAAYLSWWLVRGDLAAPAEAQATWDRALAFPMWSVGEGMSLALRGLTAPGGWHWVHDALLSFVVVVALVAGRRFLPSPFATYAWLGLLIPLAYPLAARPLLSVSRFAVVLFPIAWAAAGLLRDRRWFAAAVSLSALGWVASAVAFMNWRFIV